MPHTIHHLEIRTAHSTCPIQIGRGAISLLASVLGRATQSHRIHVVADQRVWELHDHAVASALRAANLPYEVSLIVGGESGKTLAGLSAVLDDLAAAHVERGDAIVAVGGGVTTDLAGFAAAVWQRGVPWICCPTSLEGAIDAGIGGKTAINLSAGKNLVGAFHHPRAVLIDLDLLATLPQRDYVAALAESVKHGLVARPEFLDWQRDNAAAILRRDSGPLAQLIETNVAIKTGIVAADERETATHGVGRAALNLGHTIGHALEAMPHLDLRHGETVALGLRAALALAAAELQFPPDQRLAVESLLDEFGLPRRAPAPFDPADILARLRHDKKTRAGQVRFVLPRRLGNLEWWIADNTAAVERALAGINCTSD